MEAVRIVSSVTSVIRARTMSKNVAATETLMDGLRWWLSRGYLSRMIPPVLQRSLSRGGSQSGESLAGLSETSRPTGQKRLFGDWLWRETGYVSRPTPATRKIRSSSPARSEQRRNPCRPLPCFLCRSIEMGAALVFLRGGGRSVFRHSGLAALPPGLPQAAACRPAGVRRYRPRRKFPDG